MVILETAAIGAAGYGLYRGGDAAVRKSKDAHKELKRERVRQSQRSELQQKTKTRQERVAELLHLRQGKPAAAAAPMAATPSLATRAVDDRHKNVMEKLRSSRAQKRSKQQSQGAGAKLKGLLSGRKK